MSKKYISKENEEICHSLSYWKDYIKDYDIAELELFEMVPSYGTGYFWCKEFMEIGEVGDSCGKQCRKYSPRNGKSGRCKFSNHVYEQNGKSITIKNDKINN